MNDATFSNANTTTNEPTRIIHQLQDGPDISLDGDSIVFNPNNIDDDIRGKLRLMPPTKWNVKEKF